MQRTFCALALGALAPFFAPALAAGAVPENPDPARLVWIPPGTFTMGSPTNEAERSAAYEVQHRVTFSHGFFMRRYLVVQGDYLAVMGTNPSNWLGDKSLPVEQVTWYDATNYCAQLTQQEQEAGRLPAGWVYRLPTEGEWEYACRAGTTTAFYFGNAIRGGMYNFDSHYEYDSVNGETHILNPTGFMGQTTPVGTYPPNAWGLYDMVGNTWEWCHDWYARYPAGSVTDPAGPASGTDRVMRGASWISHGFRCRSAARYLLPPERQGYNIGFRVVLAPATDLGPPVILAQPQAATVPAGADVTFSVAATGCQLSYQWRFNGTDIPGATTNTCLLTNVTLASAGSYSVVITNIFGLTNSQAAALTVARGWPDGLDLRYTEGATSMPYRLYLPKDYSPATNYPLVLFLHAEEERGTNNAAQVQAHLAGLIERTWAEYPAILVAPQLATGSWSPRNPADLTLGILAQVRRDYTVDERRIYLTGLSLGGFGATEYAYYFPGVFAAIAPISGARAIPPSSGTRLSCLPTWLFHGSSDPVVPATFSRNYFTNVTGLAAISFTQTNYGYPTAVSEPIRYTEFTYQGHEIGEGIYAGASTALYDWMFAQVRPAATARLTIAPAAGGGFDLVGCSDVPFATAYLLSATNLLSPPSPWPCLATNWFDASGRFTIHLDADGPWRFFRLKSP